METTSKMPWREKVVRYIFFLISLFFCGLAVALNAHSMLGVSPISSVAYVIALKVPSVSMGTWLFIWNMVMLLIQLVLLRREFPPVYFMQIPLSLIFGVFTDLGSLICAGFSTDTYFLRLLCAVLGVVVMAFGISIAVTANVVYNSGEAVVKVMSDKMGRPFGHVKIGFDVSCVLLSVVMSLAFFHLQIVSVREGTLISAVFCGVFITLFGKFLPAVTTRLIYFFAGKKEGEKDV